jgi:hypothetical protein
MLTIAIPYFVFFADNTTKIITFAAEKSSGQGAIPDRW